VSASAKTNGATAAEAPRAGAAGAARSAARLGAVQALYQIELSGGPAEAVLEEFLEHRLAEEIEGVSLDAADRNLFAGLVRGVAAELAPLDDLLSAVLAEDWPVERLETLLKVILRAGAYELGYRPDIPPRATITEYVNLARAFFDGKEPGLANGVLDRLAHELRPEAFETQADGPDEPEAG
jgi:N utilization substance protein B